MLSLFGFGKKRRVSKKVTSKKLKSVKPPAKLLKMCKKLHVKVAVKRGSKRVYKPLKVLVKECKEKLMMLKKKALKSKVPKRKVSKRKVAERKTRFGDCSGMYKDKMMEFGSRKIRFGGHSAMGGAEFGKKRKVSKVDAMKAFKAFYRKHCTRPMRFGDGGNPALSSSMGYEFCPLGRGGVLSAESTGLFPSPCSKLNPKEYEAEKRVQLGKRFSGQDEQGKTAAQIAAMNRAAGYKGPQFGKKLRVSKKAAKPAAKLLMMCKKYKIKATVKRGSKRVYKSTSVLNKQLKKKLKSLKK
uniref:Uncharacterized protein n=1 Tax=viral metagenome TaxID=1070528 RepID=A0A6C0I9R5_9ZZZZ